jgi:hypothetical protein
VFSTSFIIAHLLTSRTSLGRYSFFFVESSFGFPLFDVSFFGKTFY